MSDPLTIAGILMSVVTSAGYDTLKSGMKYLLNVPNTPVTKAIAATCSATPDVDSGIIEDALRRWCLSQYFQEIVNDISAGEVSDLTDPMIVDGFIEVSQLYFGGDEQRERCGKLLLMFTRCLRSAIYDSPQGMSTLANRLEVRYDEIHEKMATQESVNKIQSAVARIERLFPNLAGMDTAVKAGEQVGIVDERLRIAKDLVNKGKLRTAEQLLHEARQQFDKNTSADVIFRTTSTLADCLLKQKRIADSIAEFQAAVRISPAHKSVPNYRALIAFLQRDPSAVDLAREAFETTPENNSASANIYLLALDLFADSKEIFQTIDSHPWIAEDPECAYVLGSIYLNLGLFQESEVSYRKALADKSNSHALLGLGTLILVEVQRVYEADRRLVIAPPPHVVDRLQEAERYLDDAIVAFREGEDNQDLITAYINRAAARAMRQDHSGARDDCRAVLHINPNERTALMTAGQTSIILQEYQIACDYLEGIDNAEDAPEVASSLAEAYSGLNRHDRVVTLLEPIWQQQRQSPQLVAIADQLMAAYWSVGAVERAEEMMLKIDTVIPNKADARYVQAHQYMREARWEDAARELRTALQAGDSLHEFAIKLDLAHVLFHMGNYGSAADLYAEADNEGISTFITRRLLLSLFYGGQYATALHRIEAVKDRKEFKILALDIKAEIEELYDNLDDACALRQELLTIDPMPRRQIALARVLYRRGEVDEARMVLAKVQIEHVIDEAEVLFAAGRLRILMDMPDGSLFAYYARRAANRKPSMHQKYMGLILAAQVRKPEEFEVDRVGPDTAVTFKRHGKAHTYLLEARIPTTELYPSELPIQDGLARSLVGLCVGDSFTWKAGSPAAAECVITKIQYKPLAALKETFTKFGMWFPDDPAITEIHVDLSKSDWIEKLIEIATAKRQFNEFFEQQYRSHRLPIQTFAKLISENIIVVWLESIRGRGLPLYICQDTAELNREVAASKSTPRFVLDLTSLLTLARLDMLGTLAANAERVFVAQSTYDELKFYCDEHYRTFTARSRLGAYAGQIVLTEQSQEDWEWERDLLGRAMGFVEQHCVLKGAKAADSSGGHEDNRQTAEILGLTLFRSAQLSLDEGAVLLCDDMLARRLACEGLGCSGASTISLILALRERACLTDDELKRTQVDLCEMGFKLIPINAGTIMWAAAHGGYQISDPLKRVLDTLSTPIASVQSVVEVASEIAIALWTEWPLNATRPLIFDLLLSALMTGRKPDVMLQLLRNQLRKRMALLPRELADIEKSIDLWMHVTTQQHHWL